MPFIRDFIDSQFKNDRSTEVGIGGFTALARVRERTQRTSTVPVTYLEDGTNISDHIIREPLVLRIEGNVSDLHVRPSRALQLIRRTQREIGNISQYLPRRTRTQVNKINSLINDLSSQIDKVDEAIRAGRQLSGFLGNISRESLQQKFVDEMEANHAGNHLIRIDMPFASYSNMRITNLEIERDNQNLALNFVIDAQQLQFTQTFSVQIDAAKNPSTGLDGAVEALKDKGIQEGLAPRASTLRKVSNKIANLGGR